MSVEETRTWLALLVADPVARPRLSEIARFMLATGLRLGEALGVTWADLGPDGWDRRGPRVVVRVKGRGLGVESGHQDDLIHAQVVGPQGIEP